MNDLALKNLLETEVNETFEGWDFSYLSKSGRMQEFPLTWNYPSEIETYLKKASCMLDMGTGGGEFLLSLKDLPKQTFATEGYEPNVKIAQENLKAKKVEVRSIAEDIIPFEANKFDLIINRHESYKVTELHRVLQAKGIFITQQAGGMNDLDINMELGCNNSEYFNWCLNKTVTDFENNNFEIIKRKECITKTRFYDIGAIAYYLKCIPWQIADFSIEKYFDKLKEIHKQIEIEGYKDFINHRFLIIASKK